MDLVNTAKKYNLRPTLHSDYNMQKVDPLAFVHDAVNRIINPNPNPN